MVFLSLIKIDIYNNLQFFLPPPTLHFQYVCYGHVNMINTFRSGEKRSRNEKRKKGSRKVSEKRLKQDFVGQDAYQ
jgi:hypothetical protein